MALWDIIEKLFNAGLSVGNKIKESAEAQYSEMEQQIEKAKKRCKDLSDKEVKQKFDNAEGIEKTLYGIVLKDRG